jgi:glucose-1-phosphate adenylyltransferase
MALVLAGGGGEALSVLTAERAVSAVPFGGKYRVIDFVLSNCCHSEIGRVGILTQHAPTSLHDHVGAGRPWDLDRRSGGVSMLQPYLTRGDAGWYKGTADAIAQNWDIVEHHDPERVLVLSGDHVYRMDYRALVRTHEARRARVTLAVVRVPASESRRFGMVTLEGDGRVVRLDEKPERATTPFASMGIYVFDTDVLGARLNGGPVNLVLDVLRPLLEAGEDMVAHEFTGYWDDIGEIGAYYRANLELVAPAPRLALYDPRWPLLTRDEERPAVRVRESSSIERSLIANGCCIEGVVRRSVLFPGVHVGRGAEVTDSVVMQDVMLEPGSLVDRAILDKHTRVGERAVVGHGDPPRDPAAAWLEGLTLVGKDAEIPAGARIGRAAVIGVGAGAADFDGGGVPAGTVIGSRAWYEGVV